MKSKKLKIKNHGFTLLEILIAMFLFGLVASTIFGAYTNVFQTVKSTEDDALIYIMAKNCMDRILMDLESIYIILPPVWKYPDKRGDNDPDPDLYRIQGEMDGDFSKLRFTSHAHVPLDGSSYGGIAQIVYYVTEDDQQSDNMVLRRWDTLEIEKEFEENDVDPILCEYLKSFKFTYVYYDEEDDEPEDIWDSESDEKKYATPRAIEIRLELVNPKSEDEDSIVFETRATLPVYRPKDEKIL
ncbi:general secretion pathway protein J [Candidatus Magnetomoraceae bacterium gMMP-15]